MISPADRHFFDTLRTAVHDAVVSGWADGPVRVVYGGSIVTVMPPNARNHGLVSGLPTESGAFRDSTAP